MKHITVRQTDIAGEMGFLFRPIIEKQEFSLLNPFRFIGYSVFFYSLDKQKVYKVLLNNYTANLINRIDNRLMHWADAKFPVFQFKGKGFICNESELIDLKVLKSIDQSNFTFV